MSSMNSGTRRVVYGLNVVVTIALAIVVTLLVIWAAGRWGGRVDLTSSGRNSISPRTAQLLKGLDGDVTLTGFYTLLAKDLRPNAEKHRDRVADLLDLYESAGRGKITVSMIDPQKAPADAAAVRSRLVTKPAYKDEAAGHIEALNGFPELNRKLAELIKVETDSILALQQKDKQFENLSQMAGLDFALKSLMRDTEATQTKIDELRGGAVPKYGAAVQEMRSYLTAVQKSLQDVQAWMTKRDNAAFQALAQETREFLSAAATRYTAVLTDIEASLKKTADLKEVKLEQIYEQLRSDGVLVETEREAVVVPGYEIWRYPRDKMPTGPDEEMEFHGEAAISSAILKLTQKEKSGVVFVRFGGPPMLSIDPAMLQGMTQLPRIPFGMARDAMEKENFITGEWDVQSQPDPPQLEGVTKTIYVVFPPVTPEPDPRNPRMPPPGITPEQKQKVLDAVDKSGMAVFLVNWSRPSQMNPMGGKAYEFADYLSSRWGIQPDASRLAMQFFPNPQKPELYLWDLLGTQGGQIPGLDTEKGVELTPNEIGQPLKTQPIGLTYAVPILTAPAASQPAGVKIEPVITAPASADVWAVKDIQRAIQDMQEKQGTQRYPDDSPGPFPLAVAASRDGGAKLVVIGSDQFFADAVLQLGQLVQIGSRIGVAQLYPGNADLFLNSLHWLSGNAARIAIGPSVGDIPRLTGLKDQATANTWKAILVGVWPGLALVAGGFVWLMRRR
ncbi:MAG: Gldg family protein [Phycisphaerales bacterium]|nr:Gldg family protein [Phycisphaerales bacterium]